ncbi:MAG TPA: hypothetical protein GXX75_18195 [Clostridiales bacterium]|nr:hypothetical protein [Clostridiales bacterium]
MMDDMDFYERQELNDIEFQEEDGEDLKIFQEIEDSAAEDEFDDQLAYDETQE